MKYMLTLIGEEGGWEDATPEQMRAEMGRWDAYTRVAPRRGRVRRRRGAPGERHRDHGPDPSDGERVVTDGPFAETKEQVGGFYLIECEDLDQALEWAKKIPAASGGAIEVRPVMDYEAFGAEEPAAAEAGS